MTVKSSEVVENATYSVAAKRVRAQLDDADLKELLKTPALGAKEALQRLDDLPRPIADKAIVAAIMAMQKARASEGEFARALAHIKLIYADYPPAFLKGARDLCMALIESRDQLEAGGGGASNIVNKSGFKGLVQYLRDGLEQLNSRDPKMFRHGTELARIVEVKEEDSATVQAMNLAQFTAAIPVHFEKKEDKNFLSVPCPREVAEKVYNTPNLPLPYLAGVTRFPTFGADGALHTDQGYSVATATFYAPPVGLLIPDVGGWKDEGARQRDLAEAKRLLIEELLADFPFDGWSRDRSMDAFHGRSGERLPASLFNALAVLVTPFVRAMVAGPVPLALVSKPQAGTGATYLIELLQIIVSGTATARPPLAGNEEERRKALFTAVQASEAICLYDNQKGVLDSPSLASVLTSTSFTDRVLGSSAERSLPVRSVFAMTSNNLTLSEELQRRVSLVRLHAQTADPKSRDCWRHPSLHAYAEVNRAQLLWAILTLVANWVHRGCQRPRHCPAVPSYGGWCFVLGGILEAADSRWTTFQHNRGDIGQFASAGEEDGMNELVAAWAACGGDKTSADLAALIEADGIEIEGVKLNRDGAPSPVSVGKQLAAYAGRRFVIEDRELELIIAGERNHSKLWALVDRCAAPSGAKGNADTLGPLVPATYRNYPLHADPVAVDARGMDGGLPDQSPVAVQNRRRGGTRARFVPRRQAAELAKCA